MHLTCETGSLADAIAKAARVAPNKGSAFDHAHGIVLEMVNGDPDWVYVKACDMESTFLQRVRVIEASGAGAWRLPSAVLAGFMAQLPLGDGSVVTMKVAKDHRIQVKSGKTKALFKSSPADGFPRILWFDESGLQAVPNFAQKCQQVAWAIDREHADILSGVHINGTMLTATDKAKLAQVPCAVPIETPITAPLTVLASVMKNTEEVKLRADARRLYLMTDQDTQCTSVLYMQPYPNVDGLVHLMDTADKTCRINGEAFRTIVNRMLVLCKTERYPLVSLRFKRDSVMIKMDVPDLGRVDDELEISYDSDEQFDIHFTPGPLMTAMDVCAAKQAVWNFGPTNLKPLAISDGTGYRTIMMPRRDT